MLVYISGPMSGIADLNRPAFDNAVELIKSWNHRYINPHDWSPDRRTDESEKAYYDRCIDIDLRLLALCDAIYQLSGWEKSNGATIEHTHSIALGIPVVTF